MVERGAGADVEGHMVEADEGRVQDGLVRRDERKGERRGRRWLVRLVVLAVLVGGLRLVGLDGKFYYPTDEVYSRPEELRVEYENVRFEAADGVKLAGWFLPARGVARGVVVHFHGNAGNITAHLPLASWLPEAGYHTLMFDYRGYGESEGRVSRAGTIRDGRAAVDYALSRAEAEGLPLFAYGQSLGGAVALVVAAEREEIRAVVAESTFSSYRGIAARHARQMVGVKWLGDVLAWWTISAGYDPLDVVGEIAPRGVMIIVAEKDAICFPELGEELYAAAGEPRELWRVPGVEHLEIPMARGAELAERVRRFFEGMAGR